MVASLLRRRALMMLVAFGVGLLVQVGAVAAMSMPQSAGMAMPASPASGHCPGCDDHGSSKAMAPCLSGLQCSLPPAILGEADSARPISRATFALPASVDAAGITCAPDLGPPRLLQTI